MKQARISVPFALPLALALVCGSAESLFAQAGSRSGAIVEAAPHEALAGTEAAADHIFRGALCAGDCDVSSMPRPDATEGSVASAVQSALSISRIDPAFVPESGGRVVIRGSGFTSGLRVEIGGAAAAVVATAPDFVVVNAPASAPGAAEVVVYASNGESARAIEPLHYARRQAFRVKDIETKPFTEDPRPPLGAAGETLYYTASDPLYGSELWKSDGTGPGTAIVADLCPGSCSSSIYEGFSALGLLFFHIGNEDQTMSLWRTDGTAAGTRKLTTLSFGGAVGALELRGQAFFTVSEAAGPALWSTDGTEVGTRRIISFAAIGVSSPGNFVVVGDQMFFSAAGASGIELYVTNGTAAGTRLAADISRGTASSSPSLLTAVGDELFFIATEPMGGRQLWKWSSRGGATRVSDPARPLNWIAARRGAAIGGKLLVFIAAGADRDSIVTSDGTAQGTARIAQVSRANGLVVIGNSAIFSAADPQHGLEVWRSDGTTAGTSIVRDIEPGPAGSGPWHLTRFGQRAVFRTDRGELWITDGSAEGTTRLVGTPPAARRHPESLTPAGTRLFYVADDGEGPAIWVSNGTPEGTWRASRYATGPSYSSSPRELTPLGRTLLFVAKTVHEGTELWRSDGSDAGTSLVADISPGETDGLDQTRAALTVLGNAAYFLADDGTHGLELWRSDGTAAGTRLIKDIAPGRIGAFNLADDPVVAAGGLLYFLASAERYTAPRLWRSDGTDAGTWELRELSATSFHQLIAAGDRLLLVECNSGCRLWTSDGTPEGTSVATSLPGSFGRHALVGDLLFYDDPQTRELWRSDGTASGTFRLRDGIVDPWFEPAADRLYFVSDSALWVSDGTPSGTVKISDVAPFDALTRWPLPMRGVGRNLYFVADDGVHGRELWRSDGTAAGTAMVAELIAGPNQTTQPHSLTAVGDDLYFVVPDSLNSRLLWKSDGTAAGTTPLATGLREPYEIAATNSHLFFVADGAVPGAVYADVELWGLRLADMPRRRSVRH